MKKIITLMAVMLALTGCEEELTQEHDAGQKPAKVKIKGFSNPDVLQLRLNGQPVLIDNNETYTQNIETTLDFVVDKLETNLLEVHNMDTDTTLETYAITYDNIAEHEEIYFFNLPGIFLQTYAIKPTVNLGKIGFVFLFPNLGEFSGSGLENVKGILKRENGTVLASFEQIGKENFSELTIYNYFSATAPVFLELYKPGTTEPYAGTAPIVVTLKQVYINNDRVNMVVLQEKQENGTWVVKGDIDIADYL